MKVITGDLVTLARDGNFDVIVQGCNCFCVMGSGIARQIRESYPEVFAVDKTTCPGDENKLGTYTQVTTRDKFVVINAYTQFHFGQAPEAKNGVLADYEAIRKAFRTLKAEMGGKGLRFGIPKIGAGLARGDWSVIEPIIEEEMSGEDVTLVLFVG